MKFNEIRKLAKEIRTGECRLGYEELAKLGVEIKAYIDVMEDEWSDRAKAQIASDFKEISEAIDAMAPVEEAPVKEKVYVADLTDDVNDIPRKAFKTVLKEMAIRDDPQLEAVRWFSVVYRKDGCRRMKCVRGMLKRRGYGIEETEFGFNVMDYEDKDKLVAVVRKDERDLVEEFEIIYAA